MGRRSGFAFPVYSGDTDDGTPLMAIPHDDFEQIREGYGCANCGELREMYLPVCDVCGAARDVEKDFQVLPEDWKPSREGE